MLVSLTITTVSASYSQSSDTIVLNRQHALKVLSKGLEAKALQEQRDLLINEVDTLKARIVIKEMIIANMSGQITDYKSIVQSHENIINTMKDQRSVLESQIATLNKQIKKEQRKKRWVTIAGVLTTAGSLFLYFSK